MTVDPKSSHSSTSAGQDTLASSGSASDVAVQLTQSDKAAVATEENSTTLNGGFVAWSQVLVSFLLVFNSFGYFSSFGLFQSHWTEALHAQESDVALVGSVSLFLIFFLGSLSGPLMDRGYFRSLISVGCFLHVLAVFSTSAVGSYWQLFLAQGLAQGVGSGLLFTPCITLVAIYFTEGAVLALSVAACGAPAGGVVFTLIYQQLSVRLGAPWTIRIMGFIVLLNATFIMVLGRPKSFKKDRRSFIELSAFKEPVYALFAVGIFFTLLGLYIGYFYTSTYGRTVIGISQSESLVLLMVLNVAGLPGRLVPAYLANQFFGSFNTLLPFTLGCSILFFVWIRITTNGAYYAFVALYGICTNAVQTLFPSALSSLIKDPSKMGQRVGMVFSVGSLACLMGPPLAGVLIRVGKGDYLYMQLYGGVSILLGFVFMSLSRFMLSRTR